MVKHRRSKTSNESKQLLRDAKSTKKVIKKVGEVSPTNLGSKRVQKSAKKPVNIEILKSKLIGEQDTWSDHVSSISKVYWSKKKNEIVA